MVQKYQSPVRVYKKPFELGTVFHEMSVNNTLFGQIMILKKKKKCITTFYPFHFEFYSTTSNEIVV